MLKASGSHEFEIAFGRKIPKRHSTTTTTTRSSSSVLEAHSLHESHSQPHPHSQTHVPSHIVPHTRDTTPLKMDKTRRKPASPVTNKKVTNLNINISAEHTATTPGAKHSDPTAAHNEHITPGSRKAPTPKFTPSTINATSNASTPPSMMATKTTTTSPRDTKSGLVSNNSTATATRRATVASSPRASVTHLTANTSASTSNTGHTGTTAATTSTRSSITAAPKTSPRASMSYAANTKASLAAVSARAASPRPGLPPPHASSSSSPRASTAHHHQTTTTSTNKATEPHYRAPIAAHSNVSPSTTTHNHQQHNTNGHNAAPVAAKKAVAVVTVPAVASKMTVSIAAKMTTPHKPEPFVPKPMPKPPSDQLLAISASLLSPTKSFLAKSVLTKPPSQQSIYTFPATLPPPPSVHKVNSSKQSTPSSHHQPPPKVPHTADNNHFTSITSNHQMYREQTECDDEQSTFSEMGLDEYADTMVDDVDLDVSEDDNNNNNDEDFEQDKADAEPQPEPAVPAADEEEDHNHNDDVYEASDNEANTPQEPQPQDQDDDSEPEYHKDEDSDDSEPSTRRYQARPHEHATDSDDDSVHSNDHITAINQAIGDSIDEIDSDVDVDEELAKTHSYRNRPAPTLEDKERPRNQPHRLPEEHHNHGIVPLYHITYTSKNDPSLGVRPFTKVSAALAERINQFAQHEGNAPTSSELACELIAAAMRMDFDPNFGTHWKHDFTSCKNVESEEVLISHGVMEEFEASEGYEWDWRDIFSQARATANIVFNHAEHTICIKEYSYFCSSVFDENYPHRSESSGAESETY